jgi:Protein of unknown function (DUF3754)
MLQRVMAMRTSARPAAAVDGPAVTVQLPKSEAYRRRDRYIPVSRRAVLETLSSPDLWPGFDPATVRTCFRYLAHWRHLNYADQAVELIESYQPFNPDRDIAPTALMDGAGGPAARRAFIDSVRGMLERANYDEIPREKLQALVDEENPYGLELEVNLGEFSEIILYVRGEASETVHPDMAARLRGKKSVEISVFQRVFLLICLKPAEERIKEIMTAERVSDVKARKILAKNRKALPKNIDDSHVYIKMFKDMPRPDLEVIFPNTRIKLRSQDKVTIGASAGSGIGMGVVGTVTKIVAAALTPIGAVLAILGLAGAASQQVASVVQKRTRYMLKVTRNLYFHNISSNQGALALLTERAEEEDIKEELLLYALLAKTSVKRDELGHAQAAIEDFLTQQFQVHVTFDTEDALKRLVASGLVVEHADGMLMALSPATASKHIDDMWDGYLDKISDAEHAVAGHSGAAHAG